LLASQWWCGRLGGVAHVEEEAVVVTQVAKQYREQMAVALLVVALIYLGSGLGLLFKSYDNTSIGFADKSALDGYVFTHPVLVASLVIAVLLVAVWGDPSRHARTIALAAVGIGAVALVFAVITWIAAFSADENRAFSFTGILGAGKVVGALVGAAQIALLVLALFFAGMALQALPVPVRATSQWGQYNQPGWGPAPDWQQQGQWAGQHHEQYLQHQQQQQQQQQYGQQPPPWGAPQGPWGQPGTWAGWQPQQPQQPPGWGHPSEQAWQHPGYGSQQSPPDAAPTQAYEQPAAEAAPDTAASNAERYWRSATPQESEPWYPPPVGPAEPAERSDPAHLAAEQSTELGAAADDVAESTPAHAPQSFAEPGEHADQTAPDAEQTAVESWSSEAGPNASELAAASSDDDDGVEPDSNEHDEHTDDSGWWRPSSRS
jgi:hypothetical protein